MAAVLKPHQLLFLGGAGIEELLTLDGNGEHILLAKEEESLLMHLQDFAKFL